MDVIKEEAAQDLIQGSVHFQSSWGSHQPLQQVLQLFSHVLQTQESQAMERKDCNHTEQGQCTVTAVPSSIPQLPSNQREKIQTTALQTAA